MPKGDIFEAAQKRKDLKMFSEEVWKDLLSRSDKAEELSRLREQQDPDYYWSHACIDCKHCNLLEICEINTYLSCSQIVRKEEEYFYRTSDVMSDLDRIGKESLLFLSPCVYWEQGEVIVSKPKKKER